MEGAHVSIDSLITDLTFLEDFLSRNRLLESEGVTALREAIGQLEGTAEKKHPKAKKKSPPWEFKILPEQSLRFVYSTDGSLLQPDLFCKFSGPSDNDWPWKEQSLVVRLWSTRKEMTARVEYDSKKVIRILRKRNWQRVVARMHFDKADTSDKEPLFHLQFGGKAPNEVQELCWFPSQIVVPRLPYHPVDIVLASELIVANFFPDSFETLRKEPEWRALIARSQHRILKRYTEVCQSSCSVPHAKDEKTLLMRLINA